MFGEFVFYGSFWSYVNSTHRYSENNNSSNRTISV